MLLAAKWREFQASGAEAEAAEAPEEEAEEDEPEANLATAYCGISDDPSGETSEGEITSDTTTMVQIKQSEETHNDHGYTRPMTPPTSKGAPPLAAVSADPAKKIKVCKESYETKVNLL